LLRRYRASDSADFYQMLLTNADHLYEFMPADLMNIHRPEDVAVIFQKHLAEWDLRNLFRFGAWDKVTGAFIGESYLANPDWHVPCIEVGYFTVQPLIGKGYATEAARATVQFAFEHLGVGRIELQCRAENLASQRVAEKCGFTLEGRFRQSHRRKDDVLVDVLWYGLLRSDWQRTTAKHDGH
jgi:RimJ/RimL family protein N-acetyltransferase